MNANGESHEPDPAQQKTTILVVDDDASLVRALRITLRSAGYTVLLAADGMEALDVLSTQDVSAIVLDLRMPGMDGREFYREIRRRGVAVPVLICSSHEAYRARTELGAEGAIAKPFYPEQLVAAVKRVLAA